MTTGDLWVYPLRRGDTLASNDWIEWHLHRFLASHFVARMVYLGRRDVIGTAVILWSESYRQDPAGTLPDDDIELAQLARYGADLEGWREVRDLVLHGWSPVLIETDTEEISGRLGHEVIAGIASRSARRRDGRKQGREAARLAVMRSRIKSKMAELGQKRLAENAACVTEVARFLDQSNLYVTEENVRGAMAAVLGIGGQVVALKTS